MKVNPTQYSAAIATLKTNTAEQRQLPVNDDLTVKRIRPIEPAIGEAQSKMMAMPEVEIERVQELKEAISSGKISVDLDALTLAMQKYYQR